jgi:DNA polymerase elongation subunit (family B)
MKHLEDTPWWICDPKDDNYVIYSDTDSIYIHAEPLLSHLHPNFHEMESTDKDDALEVVALKYQDIITDSYNDLAANCFNVHQGHRLEMKTECVIRSAYFRATRRYAQWITKSEGIVKESLDVKGLEFKKANFPPVLGKFFHKALVDVLKGTPQSNIDKRVKIFKTEILDGTIPLTHLGNPTNTKTLNKYTERQARAGELLSSVAKGAPAAVRAAIRYNDLLRFWNLTNQHNLIAQGTKIKWIYLKPNPYHIDCLAYLDYDLPPKINDFMEKYADRQKVFDSILLNKLEGFYSDLGWTLSLNPYKDKFFNFD